MNDIIVEVDKSIDCEQNDEHVGQPVSLVRNEPAKASPYLVTKLIVSSLRLISQIDKMRPVPMEHLKQISLKMRNFQYLGKIELPNKHFTIT